MNLAQDRLPVSWMLPGTRANDYEGFILSSNILVFYTFVWKMRKMNPSRIVYAQTKLKMKKFAFLAFLLPSFCLAQNYTSYFTGSAIDKQADPKGGICLMGGATENDSAMSWFLQRAGGAMYWSLEQAAPTDTMNTCIHRSEYR